MPGGEGLRPGPAGRGSVQPGVNDAQGIAGGQHLPVRVDEDKVPDKMTVCTRRGLRRARRPQGSPPEEVMFELRPVGDK